ncbi:coiled-coil domain-containing protein 86 [Trichonephila inaurata madagascariensis]|uniref:Coiled-coil domain-containing protein 86 n=1 Tax=Trichonephila inaurata madagascariensis TaxID=2747483 RepID=A0A8X6XDM7_9ARAC|nr:coiled-coil domain-containing protein 86 [Trichonephila inaurata madagascariensis]
MWTKVYKVVCGITMPEMDADTDAQIIPIKGKPKSGRVWKCDKSKFSSMCQVKPLKLKWARKQELRQERKDLLSHVKEIKERKEREEELRKQKRRERLERKRENEIKSEVVQVIRNTAKLKRMRKKDLKMIRKRDTNPKPT